MNRKTLERILDRAEGTSSSKGEDAEFAISEEHRLTFYLGRPGQAMEISNVSTVRLEEGHVELTSRDGDTVSFIEYDALHAVRATRPSEDKSHRTGF